MRLRRLWIRSDVWWRQKGGDKRGKKSAGVESSCWDDGGRGKTRHWIYEIFLGGFEEEKEEKRKKKRGRDDFGSGSRDE